MCGSREWNDSAAIATVLEGLVHAARQMGSGAGLTVVHGAARGADRIAGNYAEQVLGLDVLPYPAVWEKDDGTRDRGAGPKRNQRMLDENPDIDEVWAFKDGFDFELRRGNGGTEDMVRRAKSAGIPAYVVSRA